MLLSLDLIKICTSLNFKSSACEVVLTNAGQAITMLNVEKTTKNKLSKDFLKSIGYAVNSNRDTARSLESVIDAKAKAQKELENINKNSCWRDSPRAYDKGCLKNKENLKEKIEEYKKTEAQKLESISKLRNLIDSHRTNIEEVDKEINILDSYIKIVNDEAEAYKKFNQKRLTLTNEELKKIMDIKSLTDLNDEVYSSGHINEHQQEL